jgi:hypothetical protein
MVDANGEDAAWLKHLLHHPETGRHETEPFAVLGTVVRRHKPSKVRIVRIFIPAVVITEVAAGIVGRIGKDEVNLPAVLVERHHGLEVLTFNDEIAGLIFLGANAELRVDFLPSRLDLPNDLPWWPLAFVCDADAARFFCLSFSQQADQFLPA